MVGERPQGGKTNLMTACEQGKILEAKIILQKKPQSIGSKDKHGKTALHYAAEAGSLACAQLLVTGADRHLLDAADSEGFTALHLSVISGHRSVARLLLKAGADPDALDKERHSAIHWAAVCGDTESLDLLLDQGANPSSPDILGAYPIHYAAQMCGAHSLNGKDPETGLETLGKLVQRGANIQCRDRDGREPLLWAASAGSSEAVLMLFTAGANISATDKDGLTALHCAASRGHTGCVETLITLCGARVDAGDHIGCTPLFYAAAQGQADCTQELLKHCADPNKQDDKGRTPAHCAAVKGRLEILRILDSNGADLWMRNSRGNLPLHEAVVSGRKDMVQWLLQQSPRAVNATNISGRTPLHIAAQRNYVEMCEILIDYGAFINPLMVNIKGFLMTPLDMSVHEGNQRCAKYLQLHGAVPATKVLENNEINRNLLFSLGNYAFHHKDRSDEEPSTAAMFDTRQDQATNERDAHTRTIRGGQQPPLPHTNVPQESELTNVVTEEASDASVHIHLSRDDLWSLWESLMQELTSEMSGSEMSQAGSELRQRTNRRSSEVKQLKPILTNVYLSRANSRTQVIAGESILDKHGDAVATRSVSEDTKLKYPRRATGDLKISLPKVAEVEKLKTGESRRTASSCISTKDQDHQSNKETSNLEYVSDSVGSDTEHQSAMKESKAVRLRKKKSDARSWGKEVEESETSSANPPGQKEDNPYLKRYLQRQTRAAEMRKYLREQIPDNDDVFQDGYSPQAQDRVPSHRRKSVSYEDWPPDAHTYRKTAHADGIDYRPDEDIRDKTSEMSARRGRSKSPAEDRDSNRKHPHRSHKHKPRDGSQEPDDDAACGKGHYHTGACRLKKRHSKNTPHKTGRKKLGTSPTQDLDRKSSVGLLEVPYQQSATTATASDERSEDISYEEQMKLHHYHYHHHHRHHHQPQQLQYLNKKMDTSIDDHHLERLKHSRRFHRRKSHSSHRSHSVGDVDVPKRLSESENERGEDYTYSGNDIRRAKSEMSGLPCSTSRDVLTKSSLPEVRERDSVDDDSHDALIAKVDENLRMEETSNQRPHEEPQQCLDSMVQDNRSKEGPPKKEERHTGLPKDADRAVNARQNRDKSPRAKSKTRKHKPKNYREKKSFKVPGTIKKSSPRRESKIPGKPPLRAAQSFSGTLSDETKEAPLKQKSQSARMEKDLPEIRVFSAEGKETEFFGKGELSEVQEHNESSNASSENEEQKKLTAKERDKSQQYRTAPIANDHAEKARGFAGETKRNARARPDSKTDSKRLERKDSLSDDDSSEGDGEPDEILYRDETVGSQQAEKGNEDYKFRGETESLGDYGEENAPNDFKDQVRNDDYSTSEKVEESTLDLRNQTDKIKEHQKTKPNIEELNPGENSSQDISQNYRAEAECGLDSEGYRSYEDDESLNRSKLEKESSIAEFEKLEKMVEMSEPETTESVKETAKVHVEDIIQRAQSEILRLESDSMDKNDNSDSSLQELKKYSQSKASTNPNDTIVLLNGSRKDNEVKIRDEDEPSEPESTSETETETKFNTDSEEVQPEPDITDLLTAAEDIEHLHTGEPTETVKRVATNKEQENVDSQTAAKNSENLNKSHASISKERFEKIETPKDFVEASENTNNFNRTENGLNDSDENNKADSPQKTDGKLKAEKKNAIDLRLFSSAEVQTDFDDVTTTEGNVRRDRECSLLGFNRSISVQTSDPGTTILPLLQTSQKLESKCLSISGNQKSISIQTELPAIAITKPKDKTDEIKEAIRTANLNDIAGKSRSNSEYSKSPNNLDKVLRSPERHNPGAVFYTAGSDLDTPRRGSEKQNVEAMFYSTDVPKTNVGNTRSVNQLSVVTAKDSPKLKVTNAKPKVLRSSVRERSLESEKAEAIANTAFHRLNSRGELTVFSSSLLTGSNNIPLTSTSSFEAKQAYQRRGEQSNLEKSGFLWVHFGSGSSPVSMKRRPSLSSQKVKRESKFIRDKPRHARSTAMRPETDYRAVKNARTSIKTITSGRKSRKVRKAVDDTSNPALQVSSKVLTDKKQRKVSRINDSILKDESSDKPKSKIPHFSDRENRRKSVLEKTPPREAYKKLETRRPSDSSTKIQQSPRIPRPCRENSFVDNKDHPSNLPNKQTPAKKDTDLDADGPDKRPHRSKHKDKTNINEHELKQKVGGQQNRRLSVNEVEQIQKPSGQQNRRLSVHEHEMNQNGDGQKNERLSATDAPIEQGATYQVGGIEDDSISNDAHESTPHINNENSLATDDTNDTSASLKTNEIDKVTTKNDVGSSPKTSRNDRRASSHSGSPKRKPSGSKSQKNGNQRKSGRCSSKRRNDDNKPPRPRLSETAKSSSLDEGDVRLVIERKADPDFSIKISMKDKHKTRNGQQDVQCTEYSSTRDGSDQSFKDSGYFSTTESVHRHRRSITIDLGHTKAMINAGIKKHGTLKDFEVLKNTDTTVAFQETVEKGSSSFNENQNGNKDSETDSQKVLPSKLPVLSGYRQRSNSMVIIKHPHTPREKSPSVDGRVGGKPRSSRLNFDDRKATLSPRESRKSGSNKYSRRASIATTGIPIHKAHSDSSLHRLGKSASRATRSSYLRLPSGNPLLSPSRQEDIVPDLSSESKSDLVKENNSVEIAESLKLPSILLSKPDETDSANSESRHPPAGPRTPRKKSAIHSDLIKETIPTLPISSKAQSPISPRKNSTATTPVATKETALLTPRSSKVPTPISPRSLYSSDILLLRQPILQQPVRCKCKIEPHQFWDGRRTKSAVECIASLQFLNEEELAQFDDRLLSIMRRSSYSGGHRMSTPGGFRAIKTQTLKRMKSGRKSVESVIFHVDHDWERNSFKLPTDKLKKNKKWQVVFTIGKSKKKRRKGSSVKKKQ